MDDLIIAKKEDVVAVANAIREKTGSSDALTFPSGFVNGIAGISSGGSNSGVETCDIEIIIDDGYIYTEVTYSDGESLKKSYVAGGIKVLKNSIISIGYNVGSIQASIVGIGGVSNDSDTAKFISGDGSIHFTTADTSGGGEASPY